MTEVGGGRTTLAARLANAGCVAPFDEADELTAAAKGDGDVLAELVARRSRGEPLAWVTGWTEFGGHRVQVRPGVYVPRRQSEALVRRAIDLLPSRGLGADLCTGSGAIAVALGRARPGARVLATDVDVAACECAAANGVAVFAGHLGDPLPVSLHGHFDVVIAVPPYVPTDAIAFLPRDVREHEPSLALDGGPQGTHVLEQAVQAASVLLHPGGSLLLEVGGDQDGLLRPAFADCGFELPRPHYDQDGDLRGVEARLL